MLDIACAVDPGVGTRGNDDRALVNGEVVRSGFYSEAADARCLVAVCDGVGGEAHGDEAAEIVARGFSCLNGVQLSKEEIADSIARANEEVMAAQKTDASRAKMATTIAGLYIAGNDCIAFNVGDSRVYRFRAPYIAQLSIDHSLKQERMDLGLDVRPEQEHVITHYFGGPRAIPEIVDGTGRVFEHDIYVLCTDGIWNVVDDGDFEKALAAGETAEETCRKLVELAVRRGSDDNMSIIIVRRI